MSNTDNWMKVYRWWQEHLKFHRLSSSSSAMMNDDLLINRHSSLISFRSSKDTQLIKNHKRSSYGGLDQHQIGFNDFRHVRDSLRGRNPRKTRIKTLNQRHPFRKATTCDVSSEGISTNTGNKLFSSMNKKKDHEPRRFSLVKFELPNADSNETKDESKLSVPYSNPNLIQKLLFRQFSPKTRPYPCDETISPTSVPNGSTNTRRLSQVQSTKQSLINSKQQIRHEENNLNSSTNKTLPVDLDSYLSKRRYTIGSISSTKMLDLKSISNGNPSHHSNNRMSFEKDIFQTVEESDFLATKQLIKTNENLINSSNEYDWYPLDIAIMLNNIPMIRLLLHYGADESSKVQPEEIRYRSVCQQLSDLHSEQSMKKSPTNKLTLDEIQSRRSTPSSDKQRHRQVKYHQEYSNEQRLLTLSQMKDNYEQAALRFLNKTQRRNSELNLHQKRVPDLPTNVRLMVTGSDNITVTFDEPLRSNGAMVTKYRIEWSSDEDFTDISFDIIKNCFLREYVIRNLTVGQKCYVRVSAGNLKGFGESIPANPPYCIPSNWREFSKTSRINICDLRFEEILQKILSEREGSGTNRSFDGNESPETTGATSANNIRNRRRSYGNLRKNLRQFFQLCPRLARTMKRGLYLISIMFNGDRILVTNEDLLPMVEVDENYGHNLFADFQWFMKLTFVWDDLKTLRPDLDRCSSATSFYLRIKLVQAAIGLQTATEINNLGRLHYNYIRDTDGNVAFVLINDLSSDTRANLGPSNFKWIPMARFSELIKESTIIPRNSCLRQIMEKLPDMIEFYHASMRRLESGLYVAYLRIQNSVDSIRVMVNKNMPGSLPCAKIRSIANVSKEEWQWLHRRNDGNLVEDEYTEDSLQVFQSQFRHAMNELFSILNLPENHFSNSRIYDSQVVEIRDDLSLIILMSTADEVNILSTPSLHSYTSFLYLPVYIFEVLQHLSNNYRFICQYSRVSICLDFELIYAQQNQREAFSINELDETRYRLNHLLSCQQDLDDIWRLSRWLVHVINCAKDKTYSGISLKSFQPSIDFKSDSSYLYSSEKTSIKKSDSGFIDLDDQMIELTFYLSLSRTNRIIPLKLRMKKTTRLNEISQMILKEQQQCENVFSSYPLWNFVWIRTNGREYLIEENLTAYDIQKRFIRFGGQIHLRSKGLSVFQTSPTFQNSSSPITNFTLNV